MARSIKTGGETSIVVTDMQGMEITIHGRDPRLKSTSTQTCYYLTELEYPTYDGARTHVRYAVSNLRKSHFGLCIRVQEKVVDICAVFKDANLEQCMPRMMPQGELSKFANKIGLVWDRIKELREKKWHL